jgi:hypothetical protein
MQNNRREIKPPQDEVEEAAKAKDPKEEKDVKNESLDQVCRYAQCSFYGYKITLAKFSSSILILLKESI